MGSASPSPLAVAPDALEDVEPLAREATFPVVAIGASAGGLEAMTELLGALPRDPGMAFVFIQHSAPARDSLLPDLLSRNTQMPIRLAEEGMKIEPDRGYVAPPGSILGLKDGSFHVILDGGRPERDGAIDYFFERLAERFRTRAIGVVLSGTLSDGALGLRSIRAAGGVAIAQSEESAKYPAMPRAAAPYVDLVLPPAEIARRLPELVKHPLMREARPEALPAQSDHQRILTMLRTGTGVNFSLYRQSTIKRRVLRRMAVNKIDEVDQYAEFVGEHPEELQALYEDILITVTAFFRDPETFDVLKARVFPALLADRPAGSPIRFWVPGCASGEEVYSLAIALMESIGEAATVPGVQLFGTDISEHAIERARRGIYLESALLAVSPERKRRFFDRVPGGYQVSKALRDVCVFARQNVGSDPPFSNLDLLSCRNLLIYLEPSLQGKVLRLFHYALKPSGYLLLGGSETVGSFSDLFQPLDRQHRIFTKIPAIPWPVTEFGTPTGRHTVREAPHHRPAADGTPSVELQRRADRIVLGAYAPPGVLLNDSFDILQFRGKTSLFLEPGAGAASLNVLKMAREGLMFELRSALTKARQGDTRVRVEGLQVRRDEGFLTANLEVIPMRDEATEARFYVVNFEPDPATKKPASQKRVVVPAAERPQDYVAKLELELASTKEYLQSIIEELQASNEELKSANEEILSSNEELQSTNEELETTKEELQSTNEELSIVNEELHTRNDELARAYNDLTDLLSGLDVAVVILDASGTIRMITGTAERTLGITPKDVGRVYYDVKSRVTVPDIRQLVAAAVEDRVAQTEREVRAPDGRRLLLRIGHYCTVEKADGVILVFIDVERLSGKVESAERAQAWAESVLVSVRSGLAIVMYDGRVRTANPAFHRLFGTTAGQVAETPLWELPAFRERAELVRDRLHGAVKGHDTLADMPFAAGGREFLMSLARVEGDDVSLLLTIDDVTDRARMQREIREMQKLESLGTLAGGIAHDFNNILNIIGAHATILKDKGDQAERRDLSVKTIQTAVRRASGVARQLLTFSRRSGSESKVVAPNALAREVVDMVSETFPKNIRVVLELDPTIPTVFGDANQLHQALLNLCVNARDAMPDGGRLVVATEVTLGSGLKQRHADAAYPLYSTLRVTDSGCGMDAETRERIFEPFFSTKRGRGSGMGLSVVYGVARAHKGFIDVESEPGKGSTFRLSLPSSREAHDVLPPVPTEATETGGTETVLVVEDEEGLRDALETVLEALGYTIVAAADGPAALEIFEKRSAEIDAVIMDLGLPGLDGMEVFRRMKKLKRDIRCMVVSGNFAQEQRAQMMAEGIMATIRKPFELHELASVLRHLLDARRPIELRP